MFVYSQKYTVLSNSQDLYEKVFFLNEFVQTKMRLCNSFFNIFLFYRLNCAIDWQLISLDFAIDFAIFTMWLQTYGWMDRQMDRIIERQTD